MSRPPAGEVVIQEQIYSFEDEFFDVISAGEEALEEFSDRWAEFIRSVSPDSYSPGTMQLLHRVSSTIGMLCESLLSLEDAAQEIQREFEAEIEAVLDHSNAVDESKSFSTTVSTRRDVSLAAEWMSRNYHNPYPSAAIRDDISRRANWIRKDVDNWFTEARKRIGWNRIRKEFFANKRDSAVQAATSFFSSSSYSLQPALETALVEMEIRAKELYTEPFQSSNVRVALEKKSSRKLSETVQDLARPKPSSPLGLVTPPHSISPSLPVVFSKTCSTSRAPTSSKRRRPDDIGQGDSSPRRLKRPRHAESSFVASNFQLPSPAASQTDAADYDPHHLAPESSVESEQPSPPLLLSIPKRRQASHSNIQDHLRFSFHEPKINRLQTVSAPVPSSSTNQENITSSCSSERLTGSYSDATPARAVNDVIQPQAPHLPSPPISFLDVHDILAGAEIPEFSFDFPDPVTCDNPVTRQTVDLALFDGTSLEPYTRNASANEDIAAPELSGGTPYASSAENMEFSSLKSLFENYTSCDQLLNLLPLQFEQEAPSIPPEPLLNLSEIETTLNPSLGLDPSSTFCLPGTRFDNILFTDCLESSSSDPTLMTSEMAKQLAQLEVLRKQQSHLQERIQSLECQISSSVTAF